MFNVQDEISNSVHTTRFWNNVHQVRSKSKSGKAKFVSIFQSCGFVTRVTMGVTSGTRTAYPSGAPEFTPSI